MGIKRIKTRSQRITSSEYLKKNLESKNRCRFWLFQKNLTELLGFTKTWKRGAKQVFGQLFYFYNLGSGFQNLDRQTRSGFQNLDRRTDGIWVSGPRQTDA
jgi:hypothetical protein